MNKPELSWQEAVRIASGGRVYLPQSQRDPISAWTKLMEVVEMLCPRWPQRPLVIGTDYRL